MNTPVRLLVIAIAAVGLAACAKKIVPPPASNNVDSNPPADTRPTDTGPSWTDPTTLDKLPCLVARVAYFDYDQSTLQSEAMDMLQCHGKWLASNPGARISLEGHADERGTPEYNLGLGERRGNSVRDLLLANGGRSEQVSVISYGEERPTCMESDESCFAKNRRAEIVYTAKQ